MQINENAWSNFIWGEWPTVDGPVELCALMKSIPVVAIRKVGSFVFSN